MRTFKFSGYHPNGSYMPEIYIESKDWESALRFLVKFSFTKLSFQKEISIIKMI